jgi:prepilin-type N-terminal cleavage/methylation domain-containing protein
MTVTTRDARGFTIIELMFAVGILSVSVLGLAGVMAAGMRNLSSAPSEVIAAQKAAQAVEAVFAARDSHKLEWTQIRNVNGASGQDGGVFLDAALPLKTAGADGLVNTADDSTAVETTLLPGLDGALGTRDDRRIVLDGFTRKITIRDVPNESGKLRSIVVDITYRSGTFVRTYTLTTYISAYA